MLKQFWIPRAPTHAPHSSCEAFQSLSALPVRAFQMIKPTVSSHDPETILDPSRSAMACRNSQVSAHRQPVSKEPREERLRVDGNEAQVLRGCWVSPLACARQGSPPWPTRCMFCSVLSLGLEALQDGPEASRQSQSSTSSMIPAAAASSSVLLQVCVDSTAVATGEAGPAAPSSSSLHRSRPSSAKYRLLSPFLMVKPCKRQNRCSNGKVIETRYP